jgi:hypothetical protein
MGSGKTSEDKVLESAAAVLGIKNSAELVKLDRKDLAKFTQRQLFECAKRLLIKGVSKLSKDELADRVHGVFGAFVHNQSSSAEPKLATPDVPVGARPTKTYDAVAAEAESEKAAASAGDGSDSVLSHKFEVREHGESSQTTTIPWSYGYDRVTGMAVDPEQLFVYWEVTDDSIEKARANLGAGGKNAWLNLRIYDTTDRIFDGTNAHSYFDHRVQRGDRHWFFKIDKPSSSAFVDIGLRSNEGYFTKIVRSGRVEFPRREPAPWGEPEWLSVRSFAGPVEHAGRGPHVRRQAPGIPSGAVPPQPSQAPRRHVALLPWEESITVGDGALKEVVEWEEHLTDGTTEFHRQTNWESPVMVSAWEAGPFSYPVSAPEPVREDFVGPSRVYRVGGRTHVVHGPWQVIIKGVAAHHGRAVVARWEIYRSWVAEESVEVTTSEPKEHVIPGSSENLLRGASERRWRYASEARLGGASEVFFLGASELRARGASERFFLGASQYKMRGASEQQYLGASEVRMRGASERMLAGASELRLGGASEMVVGGGSEGRLAGGPARAETSVAGDGHYPSSDSISAAVSDTISSAISSAIVSEAIVSGPEHKE